MLRTHAQGSRLGATMCCRCTGCWKCIPYWQQPGTPTEKKTGLALLHPRIVAMHPNMGQLQHHVI